MFGAIAMILNDYLLTRMSPFVQFFIPQQKVGLVGMHDMRMKKPPFESSVFYVLVKVLLYNSKPTI